MVALSPEQESLAQMYRDQLCALATTVNTGAAPAALINDYRPALQTALHKIGATA